MINHSYIEQSLCLIISFSLIAIIIIIYIVIIIIKNKITSLAIIKVINNSTNNEDMLEVVELSKKYRNFLLPSIGIHPEFVNNYDLNKMEMIIKNNKVYAIGEIGLDYYWVKDNKEEQKNLFISQIKLANKYNLPVIIHSRDSIQDCLNIIKENRCRGIIHCFSGSYEMAKEFIKYGFKLGIGGVLTFKNSKLSEVIKKIDLKDIVLETDSPYLTPEPYRGKTNDPSNVYYVAKKISEIKEIDIEKVIKQTTQNAIDIFDI